MEITLAVLMALGIFVGIPVIIGFGIIGIYMMSDRRVRRAKRAKALTEQIAGVNEEVESGDTVKVG